MKPDPGSARQAILNARQAMQRGDRQVARNWALQAVALDPDSEEPWLTLAAVASPRASLNYLEKALKINPDSQRARQGMQWAQKRLDLKQARRSSRQEIPPAPDKLENSESTETAPDVPLSPAEKTALSEVKTRPRATQGVALKAAPPGPSGEPHSPGRFAAFRQSRSVQRFASRWQNWIGVILVGLFVLVALGAPLISPNIPASPGSFMKVKGGRSMDKQPHPPSIVAPLGTLPGQLDVFHALVWGTRDALVFGLEVVVVAALVGLMFGAISGYAGGLISSLMMRVTDAFLAFPVIAGVVFLGQLWTSAIIASGGMWDWMNKLWVVDPSLSVSPIQTLLQAINPLMLVLILFSWMSYARITNVMVVTLKQVEFVQAAHAIGTKPFRIILRHLIPNSVAPSIVLAARDIGSLVLLQAAFTFIGLDGSSTWGNIIAMGRDWILGPGGGVLTYWWVYVPATLALVLFGIGWNLLGDGLSELLDPRDN